MLSAAGNRDARSTGIRDVHAHQSADLLRVNAPALLFRFLDPPLQALRIAITMIEADLKSRYKDLPTTHNPTHNNNNDDLNVLRRTYAAVRDLQVVEWIR
jgi:hypothetical protein